MSTDLAKELTGRVREVVDHCQKVETQYASYLRKIHERLVKLKKSIGDRSLSSADIGKAINDLKPLSGEPERVAIAEVIETLQSLQSDLRHYLEEKFPDQLRLESQQAQLTFKSQGDAFILGPFLAEINWAKEQAAISYAKVVIAKDVPLDAAALVGKAISLRAAILDPPSDLGKIGNELEEAMSVALARRRKPLKDQGRVELPQVYREMSFIRQMAGDSVEPYSVPRFVVELKRLIQSDQNLEARRQFALETAVLENTKDSRKSVFIPRDVSAGYGEGTYYQALLIKTT